MFTRVLMEHNELEKLLVLFSCTFSHIKRFMR